MKVGIVAAGGRPQRWPEKVMHVTLPVSLSSVYQPGPCVSAPAARASRKLLVTAAPAAIAAEV